MAYREGRGKSAIAYGSIVGRKLNKSVRVLSKVIRIVISIWHKVSFIRVINKTDCS